MRKFLILLVTVAALMSTAVYANINAEKSIFIKTQDCSKAIDILQDLFDNGKLNSSLEMIGFNENSEIGTPFAVEYNDLGSQCYYVFPIINSNYITGYISLSSPLDPNKPYFTVNGNGFFTGADESWEQLADEDEYIICEDDMSRKFAIAEDKNVFLSSKYEGEDNLPVPTPIYADRKVVDITEPIDINTDNFTPPTSEEQAILNDAVKNGKTLITKSVEEIGAKYENNRLLVPLRTISELIGCNVEWDSITKTACAVKDNNTIKFVINSPYYTLNNEIYNIDTAAQIYDSKTYIPIRAASEAFGAKIYYNQSKKTITLSY